MTGKTYSPKLPISTLTRNRSINPIQLRQLKRQGGPILPGMEALLGMMTNYTSDVTSVPALPNIESVTFYNNYVSIFAFTDALKYQLSISDQSSATYSPRS